MSQETDSAPILHVVFSVAGRDFDPEAVSRELGLTPTRVLRRDSRLAARTDLGNVCWSLEVKDLRLYSVDEAVTELLAILMPSSEKIRALVDRKHQDVWVECWVRINEDRPIYELSVQTMKSLVELGCDFSLDIYDYSE